MARWWLLVLGAAVGGCAHVEWVDAAPVAEEEAQMAQKLDPRLLEMVERADAGAGAEPVEVLVGLDAPLDAAARDDLVARGLSLRSEIGTILTGTVMLGDVPRVAASPRVLKLEASAPMYREAPGGGGEGPAE